MNYTALAALLTALVMPRLAHAQSTDATSPTIVALPVVVVSPAGFDAEQPPVAIDRPVPARPPRAHRSHGMLYTGISVLSASYALTAATGFLGMLVCGGSDLGCDQTPMVWLMVPVFGPFAALAYGNPSGGTVALGLLDGFVQAGSAALIVADIVRRDHDPAQLEARHSARWAVLPMAAPGTAGLSLTVRDF